MDGVVLPEGQHRDGGAILEISLLTWYLPGYSLQKKEIGDGVRSIFGAVQFIYLNAEKAQETLSGIGSRRHLQVSLTH